MWICGGTYEPCGSVEGLMNHVDLWREELCGSVGGGMNHVDLWRDI